MLETRRQNALDHLLSIADWNSDLYGELALVHLLRHDQAEEAMALLCHTANWFEHPHPNGRDLRGESDFTAIRILLALYEPEIRTQLTDEVQASIKKFFTKQVFGSIYGSENHALMSHAALYLAAQFYEGAYFENYSISAGDCVEKERKYLLDFLDFRAGRGWGEFDSLGYTAEILLILAVLHKYAESAALRTKCHMAMDVILLDMMADSLGALYAGAHGRSYPDAILHRSDAPMTRIYLYYFGGPLYREDLRISLPLLLSDYVPSPILYDIAAGRLLPYENRERKHLHCMSAWMSDIDWDEVEHETGAISKYTYLCEDYALGAINRQDDYALCTKPEDRIYAHHQQHEWELTFPGDGELKIFTHHSAIADYHRINNRWTGDFECCCGSFYANRNTLVAMYNIDNREKLPLINGYAPLDAFDRVLQQEKYLFLAYGKLYISLYFDNGYRVNQEDEFAGKELLSDGWQNAVVCRVAYQKDHGSLEDFAASIQALPVVFDRENRTVSFDGILVRRDGNSENGVENRYPYPDTYRCPFLQSDWDSKVITVTFGGKTVIYDFAANCIR